MDAYTAELWRGKQVAVTLSSGARYNGTFQRFGQGTYGLVRITIVNKFGGHTTPKHGERRRINLNRILKIREGSFPEGSSNVE